MKKGKLTIMALSVLATGFLAGCASPVAEYIETDIEPVAEIGTPVQVIRETPVRETIIESSSSFSPQRCF